MGCNRRRHLFDGGNTYVSHPRSRARGGRLGRLPRPDPGVTCGYAGRAAGLGPVRNRRPRHAGWAVRGRQRYQRPGTGDGDELRRGRRSACLLVGRGCDARLRSPGRAFPRYSLRVQRDRRARRAELGHVAILPRGAVAGQHGPGPGDARRSEILRQRPQQPRSGGRVERSGRHGRFPACLPVGQRWDARSRHAGRQRE